MPPGLQGSFEEEQKSEDGVLTHRSLLPVSRCRRTSCGGVPTEALMK